MLKGELCPGLPWGPEVKWKIAESGQWHKASSKNISSTGMMIQTEEFAEPGDTVRLSFNLPNLKAQEPIITEAEVVREVQRNGRRIGLGLRFLTLKSRNHSVVHEFVCRILDLPCDDELKSLVRQDFSGYSCKIEPPVKEAKTMKAEAAITRKMAQEESKRRKALIKLWTVRGWKAGLIFFGVFLVAKVACFFMDLADYIQGLK